MILVVIAALALTAALLGASLSSDLAAPLTAILAASVALAALTAKNVRARLTALAERHGPAGIAAIAALILYAWSLGAFSAGNEGALRAATLILALFAAAPAFAAIAATAGRAAAATGLMLSAIPLALAALITLQADLATPFGRLVPALDAPGLTIALGLLSLLALHAGCDELRRRPAPGEKALAPVAQRLFAPIATLCASVSLLVLAPAPAILAALAAGALAFTLALWPRARRSRVGVAVLPIALFVSAGAGAAAAASSTMLSGEALSALSFQFDGAAFAAWRAEGGPIRVGVFALLIAILASTLAFAKDRGRTPSRGAALLAGMAMFVLVCAALSQDVAAPGAAFVFALMAGLAASYVDLPSGRTRRRD